ncbi:MAG: AAA family ATPase [Hyphomicrobium sp.]
MVSIVEWSANRPDWVRDALRRIASSITVSAEDRQAIDNRVRQHGGLTIEGEHLCTPISDDHLPALSSNDEAVVICGLGPLQNVDRLASDQQMRFAIDGITLVYGDNGTGKSGYARVAKKMCQSRVLEELRGDVFSEHPSPPALARVRLKPPNGEIQEIDWRDGSPPLSALAKTYVFDKAGAEAYIDKQSELTYLPRELAIATSYGDLLGDLAKSFTDEIATIEAAHRGPYGLEYAVDTEAGRIVRALILATSSAELKLAEDIRAAGAWAEELEAERQALEEKLKTDPRAEALALRRIEGALSTTAENLAGLIELLGDEAVVTTRQLIVRTIEATKAVRLAANEGFKNEPVGTTGLGPWRAMYEAARTFAASAELRAADEEFLEGDLCPTCQQPLSADAVARLKRFDLFVADHVATTASELNAQLAQLSDRLERVGISTTNAVSQILAEYVVRGEGERLLGDKVVQAYAALSARRATLVKAIADRSLGDVTVIAEDICSLLRDASTQAAATAAERDAEPDQNPDDIARFAELTDKKRLSAELDAVVARRDDLAKRHCLQTCRANVETGSISRFITARRRELVTPELQKLIADEIASLDLTHVPLRVAESTERGKNYFDVALQTTQNAKKARVLSEGEQTVLGLACFLAEVERLPGKHAIIFDDPVSSLDHVRLRKVAERLVKEAANGRQLIIFTHNMVFYQEVISAAAAANPQVPLLKNLVSRSGSGFGIVTENEEPWIARKVTERIASLERRVGEIPNDADIASDSHRRLCKDFYTDLRETWERFVEEILLGGVVERYGAGVKTQSLKSVLVEDNDYRIIFAAMKRVSEFSGHDMAAGRQLPVADKATMRADLDALSNYRRQVNGRKNVLEQRRRALENPPPAQVS